MNLLIRGNTYRFDIEAVSADGANAAAAAYFDSGTGFVRFTVGAAIKEVPLDIHRIPDNTGRYRVYYTIPAENHQRTLLVEVGGTIRSLPVRFGRRSFLISD